MDRRQHPKTKTWYSAIIVLLIAAFTGWVVYKNPFSLKGRSQPILVQHNVVNKPFDVPDPAVTSR